MPRDYSSRPSDNKKKPRRKPAAKSRGRSPADSRPPGWVYLFCGLCLGLVVAAIIFIFARPTGGSSTGIEIAGLPGMGDKQAVAETQPEPEPEAEPARFAFYKMLPDYEVVIPEEEYTQPAPAAKSSAKTQPSQQTTPKVDAPGQYVIQAGSFSSAADADRRKAGLALLGMEAEIDRVELPNGKTVFRVRSKPLNDVNKLNNILGRLKAEGIDTLVMRYKG